MAQRGRPAFQPTTAQRKQVEECVSVGMSHEEVAMAIGCHRETLEKHFADELLHGRARKRAEVTKLLFAAARKGNVTAQKALKEATGSSAAAAEWEAAEGIANPQPTGRKLGKKEEQARAAQTAGHGTEWGDDLVPGGPTH
jgi:hypothetical protein